MINTHSSPTNFSKNRRNKKVGQACLGLVIVLTITGATDRIHTKTPLPGQITVDQTNPSWLRYHEGGPFFLAGPGDPEDFLYRGSRRVDGTRDGDQLALIHKLKGTGANSIYLQAIRSHGGDGDRTHNPFIDNDPGKGLNTAVLDQWEMWFSEMDKHGIVIFFFLYDDSADVWGRKATGNVFSRILERFWDIPTNVDVVDSAERRFIEAIVNRFEHHKRLIWVVAEEYQEVFTAAKVSNIAKIIRDADDNKHVIAVHKLSGLDFSEFADDPNIDQFVIQYNVETASELHAGMVNAWKDAAGRYNLNMAEVAFGGMGSGREARQKAWAVAMGGAYVMVNGMDIASTDISDLEDLGRLRRFMESTNFNEMAPHDELAYAGTEYVLAAPGRNYIAYSSQSSGKQLGLANMIEGVYQLRWLDVTNGTTVDWDAVKILAGNNAWDKPASIGDEVAVYVRRLNGPAR